MPGDCRDYSRRHPTRCIAPILPVITVLVYDRRRDLVAMRVEVRRMRVQNLHRVVAGLHQTFHFLRPQIERIEHEDPAELLAEMARNAAKLSLRIEYDQRVVPVEDRVDDQADTFSSSRGGA